MIVTRSSADAPAGEGGVCVALTFFVLAGFVDEPPEPNILLNPKCAEQDVNKNNTSNADMEKIEIFFIFASKQGGKCISCTLIYPVNLLNKI